MKKTILLKSMLLLCALIVGSSYGWATDANFSYTDFTGQGASGSGGNLTGATKGNITITGKGNGNASYLQVYANNYLIITPNSGATITSIVLTATTNDYIKTWTASDASSITISSNTATWSGSSTSAITLTNNASAQARITSIVVTYTSATPAVAYTVTYGDATGGSIKEASAGAGVTLATRVAPVGSFYTFEGWSETNLTVETTSATIIKTDATYYPSKDVTLYPVYSRTVDASDMTPASVTISSYATANSWENQTQHASVEINGQLTATASGGGNTGKYYTNDNTWRLYANESATLTIDASSGYSITSVTATFSANDNGVLKYGGSNVTSGSATSVSGSTVVFTVGSSSGSKGKIFISAISVSYQLDAVTYYTSLPDEEESKTVTEFGWATYIPAHAVSFGAGCAFVVTDASTTIKLTEVAKVPAGTPVILKKAAGGDINATVINESPADPATNLLSIGGASIPSGKEAWVLAKEDVSAGFKKWTGDEDVLEGRVVLLLDEETTARNFIGFEDEETTGIGSAKTQTKNNAEYYDLQGRRIVQPTKGLYIVNGKKVVIK